MVPFSCDPAPYSKMSLEDMEECVEVILSGTCNIRLDMHLLNLHCQYSDYSSIYAHIHLPMSLKLQWRVIHKLLPCKQ